MKKAERQDGFTLIEVIIVLAILLIVARLTTPVLSISLANSDIRTATNSLVAGLREARVTAIATGQIVRVKIRADGAEWGERRPPYRMPAGITLALTGGGQDDDGTIILGGSR